MDFYFRILEPHNVLKDCEWGNESKTELETVFTAANQQNLDTI